MNFPNREDAVIADKILQALADKGNAAKTSVSIGETEFIDMLGIDLQTIRSILEIANRNQSVNNVRAFIRTLSAIDTGDEINGFLRMGGFTKRWENADKEQKAKDKVDTVNDSVLENNKIVRLVSFTTAIVALLSLAVAILAYNHTADINVKGLPPQPIQVQRVPVPQKQIDTVYLLNPAPSQNQPTNSAKTSKTK